MVDITKIKRDAKTIQSTLFRENDQLITKTGCTIYFPQDYTSKGLAVFGDRINCLGIFAIFSDDVHYGISKATSMMSFGKCEYELVDIDSRAFFKLVFEPGSVVVHNVKLVISSTFINYVMDYFVDYGKTPSWFFTQRDSAGILKWCRYFNKINLGSQAVQDVLIAGISRDPDNINTYMRHSNPGEDILDKYPRYVPLRDIAMNTTSNLASINGSELNRGIKQTLLNEPERAEALEVAYIK